MIAPSYPLVQSSELELITSLTALRYVTEVPRPTSFQAIQSYISTQEHTFSRAVIAQNWAMVYNELAIDYGQIIGDDIEILCIMRDTLELEGLLNIVFKLESLGEPMPNESTELECRLLPTSQPQTFSLLVHHLGKCCQLMEKGGHTVSITNQTDPANSPTVDPYQLGRLPCGGENKVNNFGACGISFASDPTGSQLDFEFTFIGAGGATSTTSRTLIV